MDIREKYKDLIIAWANGETIQFRMGDTWKDIEGTPLWEEGNEYRVKPKTKFFYLGLDSDKDGVKVTDKFANIQVQVEDGIIVGVTLLKNPVINDGLSKDTYLDLNKVTTDSNTKESSDFVEKLMKELEKDKALNNFFSSVKYHVL